MKYIESETVELKGTIIEDIEKLIEVVKNLAFKHKNTVCLGRSHGIAAEVITLVGAAE